MAGVATVDNLEIQISATSQNAESALSSLTAQMEKLIGSFNKATAALNAQAKATSNSVSATNKNSSALQTLSKTAQKASQSLGAIPRALGRIAFYRAIRSVIKNITSAVKEGLTNLKEYSEAVGTAFSPAVDNLRQHVLMLKNAFATALRPIIEALIPIIIRLVDWLSKAADFIAQVMSVLTGKVDANGRYTKAVLGDLKESNKQAKQLRRTLLGFDEINRLDAPEAKSSTATNAGTMFTQADVSDKAKAVAERIQKIVDIIKDIIKRVVQFIKDNPWIITLAEILLGAVVAANLFKKALNLVLGVLHTLLNPTTLILAAIIACALWGDKIADWLDKAKSKVVIFLDGLKGSSLTINALIDLVKNLVANIFDIFGALASSIRKLFQGDFKGALKDFIKACKSLLKLVVNLVFDVANVIVGIVEDIINGILFGVRWLYNNGIAPALDWIIRGIKNIGIFFHNNFVDFRIECLELRIQIREWLNKDLADLEWKVNDAINAINTVFGTNLKPVSFKLDTEKLDTKIDELKKMKLDPITENVEIVGRWKEPAKLKLQFDSSDAMRAIDNLGQKVNRLGSAISSAVTALGGSNPKAVAITKYASGGWPSVGSLFIAGESGAEVVANFNGRTGVMNTDQMAAAMYTAMVRALQTMPVNDTPIYLDGEPIYRAVVRRNNSVVRATGRSALLT